MSERIEKAMSYRERLKENGMPFYNCAQTTVLAFAEDLGTDEETLRRMASHFGGGMKMGSVCGAVTGGLMVLGLLGIDDAQSAAVFMNGIRESREGMLNCSDLLKRNAEKGGIKKTHCDGMIAQAVGLIEERIKEKKGQ